MADQRRLDQNKNFRVVFGGALAAIAGFALVKKLLPAVSKRYSNPQDYVSEAPSGSRPIEGVATTTAAGRSAGKSGKPRSSRRAASGSAGKKTGGRPKRR